MITDHITETTDALTATCTASSCTQTGSCLSSCQAIGGTFDNNMCSGLFFCQAGEPLYLATTNQLITPSPARCRLPGVSVMLADYRTLWHFLWHYFRPLRRRNSCVLLRQQLLRRQRECTLHCVSRTAQCGRQVSELHSDGVYCCRSKEEEA